MEDGPPRPDGMHNLMVGVGNSYIQHARIVCPMTPPCAGHDAFDWDLFWEQGGEDGPMAKGAERMAARISRLISERGTSRVADFGCGAGRTLLLLARDHPEVRFFGLDSSATAVRACKEGAKRLGLGNVRFSRDSLPAPRTQDRFDLVLCIATLHYVKDIRGALRALWSMVDASGSLVFNYPNWHARRSYRKWVREMDDPALARRFALVLAGENLLTMRDVRTVLGVTPGNLWVMMGERPTRANVCLVADKPRHQR